MANTYRWSPTAQATSVSSAASARQEVADDAASVAQMWVAATYDDLRRAGPDRATQVRRVLDSYVIPWFGPRTSTVGDITYFMVHEWLLMLVGRRRGEPEDRQQAPAELGERDGELCGAYRNSHGHVRVPEQAMDDVIDLGDSGLLIVRGQGGRAFRVRDDHGRVVAVP